MQTRSRTPNLLVGLERTTRPRREKKADAKDAAKTRRETKDAPETKEAPENTVESDAAHQHLLKLPLGPADDDQWARFVAEHLRAMRRSPLLKAIWTRPNVLRAVQETFLARFGVTFTKRANLDKTLQALDAIGATRSVAREELLGLAPHVEIRGVSALVPKRAGTALADLFDDYPETNRVAILAFLEDRDITTKSDLREYLANAHVPREFRELLWGR